MLYKKYLPIIFTVFTICTMVGCSEIFEEREIIFPEIAAIATGALLSPKFGWKTNKSRIFIFIMVCAVLGVGIVYFCPGPVWIQMILAYLLSQLILNISKTSFAPMVSAIVLPVLLQTRSPAYLLSAAVFTAVILLSRIFLEKREIKAPISYEPLEISWDKKQWVTILKRVAVASLLILIAVPSGWRFMVAPPLLVAFTEFSNPESAARKKPVQAVILITGCALSGALCRYGLTLLLHLPLTVAALAGCGLMLLLIFKFKLYIPPAAAMVLLAMLIPEEAVLLLPVQVFVGISLLVAADLHFFKDNQSKKDEY